MCANHSANNEKRRIKLMRQIQQQQQREKNARSSSRCM